jgi:hypothetical protein
VVSRISFVLIKLKVYYHLCILVVHSRSSCPWSLRSCLSPPVVVSIIFVLRTAWISIHHSEVQKVSDDMLVNRSFVRYVINVLNDLNKLLLLSWTDSNINLFSLDNINEKTKLIIFFCYWIDRKQIPVERKDRQRKRKRTIRKYIRSFQQELGHHAAVG